MTLHRGIEVSLDGGLARRKIDIEEHGRNGHHSPKLLIFIIDGKRLVPYQWRRMEIHITFAGHLKMYLPDELLLEEMKRKDWLLKTIDKAPRDAWSCGVVVVPFPFTET